MISCIDCTSCIYEQTRDDVAQTTSVVHLCFTTAATKTHKMSSRSKSPARTSPAKLVLSSHSFYYCTVQPTFICVFVCVFSLSARTARSRNARLARTKNFVPVCLVGAHAPVGALQKRERLIASEEWPVQQIVIGTLIGGVLLFLWGSCYIVRDSPNNKSKRHNFPTGGFNICAVAT